ncbi:MAG: competence protein ComFB [Oleiphilus sp.]|nr:MAG: competence protein ComFB [Oleiphilus sp.]
MSLLDNIQNYYETLVVEMLAEHYKGQELELEFMTDVVCVALNHLPPRYFRHGVDMLFYTSPIERKELEDKAREAVTQAIEYVEKNNR